MLIMNLRLYVSVCLYVPLILSILNACSSSIPDTIKTPLPDRLTLQQVQNQPDAYKSKPVRWGGVIVDIQNMKKLSQLNIIAFPLTKSAKPDTTQPSPGRFIATSNDFLDPAIYTKDRHITVNGIISGSETIKIGDYPYPYIKIDIRQHYLWPVERINRLDDYPPDYWWYDPWYPWHHHRGYH